MPVDKAFRVVKGGFTSLAGEVDHVARAAIAEVRRGLAALTTRVDTAETDVAAIEAAHVAQTWSNPIAGGITVGSGTVSAEYTQVGDEVTVSFVFTFGSGSSITGTVTLTLPVAPARSIVLPVSIFDSGTARFWGWGAADGTSTTLTIGVAGAAGTHVNHVALSATAPMVWATNDTLTVTGKYLA
jgi:hypothetical protein